MLALELGYYILFFFLSILGGKKLLEGFSKDILETGQ